MNKDQKNVVTEYLSSISDEMLELLNSRLTERFAGDLAEVLNELSKEKRMDNLLSNAGSSEAIFNLLEEIKEFVYKECKKRGVTLKPTASVG